MDLLVLIQVSLKRPEKCKYKNKFNLFLKHYKNKT